jgi:uncharacterized membrane protein YphA (DoxX/SURF4 family)
MTKRNKIIYWAFTLWLALGMTSTGIGQLVKMKTGAGGADSIAHLGYPPYFLTLLGVAKILGVIAVLIPGFPRVKEWAYAGFFFMMSGAVFSHIASSNTFGDTFPSVLLLALTIISWYFRPASRKMISVSQ